MNFKSFLKNHKITLKISGFLKTLALSEIRKEYTNNPIVKQYMKFRPWKLNHTIRAKENMLFRMFATDLSYQMLDVD